MFYNLGKKKKQTRLKKRLFNKTRQDNKIYKFSITLSCSSIRQDKSKLQKQISKLLIYFKMAA